MHIHASRCTLVPTAVGLLFSNSFIDSGTVDYPLCGIRGHFLHDLCMAVNETRLTCKLVASPTNIAEDVT